MQKNWGTAENHPGFLGKLGHIGARIGEGALDSYLGPDATATFVPGSREANARDAAGYRANIEADSKENLENAQAAKDRATKDKSPWKAVGTKETTEFSKETGAPIRMLYTNENTGEQQWRDVPRPLPVIPNSNQEVVGQPTTTQAAHTATGANNATTSSPKETGSYFGTSEQPKFAEKPVGKENVVQYTEQVKSMSNRT